MLSLRNVNLSVLLISVKEEIAKEHEVWAASSIAEPQEEDHASISGKVSR